MKKLIAKLIFLLILPVPFLFLLSNMVDKGLRRSRMEFYNQWTDVYSGKTNADMLLCGSSRMVFQVSPKVMDSVLSLNSYNIGMSGWTFNMQYDRLKIYLQHNKKPRYIVQGIDFACLGRREDIFEYEQFLPYLHDTIIRRATDECRGRFTNREIYFPFFKYNNHYYLVKEGLNCYFNTGRQKQSTRYKGFANTRGNWNYVFEKVKQANPNGIYNDISPRTLADFDDFLSYCRQNDIRIILEFSPVYYEEKILEKNAERIIDTIKNHAKKFNVPFLDYTTDTICNDKKYFFDSQHLNAMGGQLFSVKLANDIKRMIDSDKVHYNSQQ